MRSSLVAALLVASAPWPAGAAVAVYDSYAAFLAQIGPLPLITQGYESGPADRVIASGARYEGISYSFANARSGRIGSTYAHFGGFALEASAEGGAPDYFLAGDAVTLNFAAPVYAIGGFFAASPSTGADPLYLTAGGGRATGGGAGDADDAPDHYFLGIISTTGMTSATFGSLAGVPGADGSFTLDDVLFYQPAPPRPGEVPEPASWATMLLGFGLCGAGLRRPAATARA